VTYKVGDLIKHRKWGGWGIIISVFQYDCHNKDSRLEALGEVFNQNSYYDIYWGRKPDLWCSSKYHPSFNAGFLMPLRKSKRMEKLATEILVTT